MGCFSLLMGCRVKLCKAPSCLSRNHHQFMRCDALLVGGFKPFLLSSSFILSGPFWDCAILSQLDNAAWKRARIKKGTQWCPRSSNPGTEKVETPAPGLELQDVQEGKVKMKDLPPPEEGYTNKSLHENDAFSYLLLTVDTNTPPGTNKSQPWHHDKASDVVKRTWRHRPGS